MSSTVEDAVSHGAAERRAASAGVQPKYAAADDPSAAADPQGTRPAGKDFPPESSRCWG